MMVRVMLAAAVTLLASAADAAERTATLQVEKMTCASCPYIVEKTLERVDGVADAKVSYEKGTAVVRFDDTQTSVDALTRATGEAGYPAQTKD